MDIKRTIKRTIKRNPIPTAFGIGIVASLLISQGNIRENAKTLGEVREMAQANTAKEMRLRASQQASEGQAEIAEQRYQKGCLAVVAQSDPSAFTSLTEGQPVLDRVRKTPLPWELWSAMLTGIRGKLSPTLRATLLWANSLSPGIATSCA
jgi:hypothetical protein